MTTYCKIHVRGSTYKERQQAAAGMVGMIFGTDLDAGPLRIVPDQLLPLLTVHWPTPRVTMRLKMPAAHGPVVNLQDTTDRYKVTAERAEIWLDHRNMGAALVMDLDSLRQLAAWEDAAGIKYA